MECCQVVRSASRSMRQASLLQPTRIPPSLLLTRQQQRFQSDAPNRSAIDELLASRRNAPISRPSILSSPRGTGLAGMLPPRPQRAGGPGSSFPGPSPSNRSSAKDPFSLISQIEETAAKFGQQTNGPKRSLFSWDLNDFKQTAGYDKVEDVRLSPSVGRIVHVTNTVDARVAIERCNTVARPFKSMTAQQRFHERPALKRKRKLREAWRQRFKKGFRAAVYRAMELRRQGW